VIETKEGSGLEEAGMVKQGKVKEVETGGTEGPGSAPDLPPSAGAGGAPQPSPLRRRAQRPWRRKAPAPICDATRRGGAPAMLLSAFSPTATEAAAHQPGPCEKSDGAMIRRSVATRLPAGLQVNGTGRGSQAANEGCCPPQAASAGRASAFGGGGRGAAPRLQDDVQRASATPADGDGGRACAMKGDLLSAASSASCGGDGPGKAGAPRSAGEPDPAPRSGQQEVVALSSWAGGALVAGGSRDAGGGGLRPLPPPNRCVLGPGALPGQPLGPERHAPAESADRTVVPSVTPPRPAS